MQTTIIIIDTGDGARHWHLIQLYDVLFEPNLLGLRYANRELLLVEITFERIG